MSYARTADAEVDQQVYAISALGEDRPRHLTLVFYDPLATEWVARGHLTGSGVQLFIVWVMWIDDEGRDGWVYR